MKLTPRRKVGLVLLLLALIGAVLSLVRTLTVPVPVFDGLSMTTLVVLSAGWVLLLPPATR